VTDGDLEAAQIKGRRLGSTDRQHVTPARGYRCGVAEDRSHVPSCATPSGWTTPCARATCHIDECCP
jgi:hypothetical protein